MTKMEIIYEIRWILEKRIDVEAEFLTGDHDNEPLMDVIFQLSAADLSYLYFELERSFGVHIEEEKVQDAEFNTISHIASYIEEVLLEQDNMPVGKREKHPKGGAYHGDEL